MQIDANESIARKDPDAPLVIVVDYDASMRALLGEVFASAGFEVDLYISGPDMFAHARLDRPGCLVLETTMPQMSGAEVLSRLKQSGVELPVIFLAGAGDVPSAVAAMREGAADFIAKPFDPENLVARVRDVIVRHAGGREDRVKRRAVWQKLGRLTPRESSVLDLVVAGKSSKEIARALQVSHRTIDIHRLHLMEKMAASSVPELIRMRLLAVERRSH